MGQPARLSENYSVFREVIDMGIINIKLERAKKGELLSNTANA